MGLKSQVSDNIPQGFFYFIVCICVCAIYHQRITNFLPPLLDANGNKQMMFIYS